MPAVACPSCRAALTVPADAPGPFACPRCRAAVTAGPPPVPVSDAPAQRRKKSRPVLENIFTTARVVVWTWCALFAIAGFWGEDIRIAKGVALLFALGFALDAVWRAQKGN